MKFNYAVPSAKKKKQKAILLTKKFPMMLKYTQMLEGEGESVRSTVWLLGLENFIENITCNNLPVCSIGPQLTMLTCTFFPSGVKQRCNRGGTFIFRLFALHSIRS
jgi:hypothetical protein